MKTTKEVVDTPKDLTVPAYLPTSKKEAEKTKRENEMKLRGLWEKDKEMVRGIFRYHECPGGMLEFGFQKYKWDAFKVYHLKDGDVYEIPRGVAKHLNTNCAYPSYTYKNDVNGQPIVSVAEKIRRTSFQSLDYVDLEDPSIKVKLGTRAAGSYTNYPASALPQ